MNIIETIKLKQRELNYNILLKEVNQKWVINKIENHLIRHPYLNLSVHDVQEQITKNPLIASFFIKDPSKQNISEKHFANMIMNFSKTEGFKNLGANNNNYLIEGQVINTINKPTGYKNIDFIFDYNNYTCICCQKYTQANGGAQDNQFNDVSHFLHNSINLQSGYIAIALVDGDYYTKQKLQKLKSINQSDNVIVILIQNIQ